jgi:hypothetical protein
MSELEPPRSPRERILRSADDPSGPVLTPEQEALLRREAEAAEARRAAMETAPEAEPQWEETAEMPPVLTLMRLEDSLTALEQALVARDTGQMHPALAQVEADDQLQGACVVLGMSFGGDVQSLVLAILQRYREIKGLR